MEFFMEKFVERQNIARFTTLLMTETDTGKRELLQKLLTDEMVKQAGHSDGRLIPRNRVPPWTSLQPQPQAGAFLFGGVGSSLVS